MTATARRGEQRQIVEVPGVARVGEAAEQRIQRRDRVHRPGIGDEIAGDVLRIGQNEAAVRREREPFGETGAALGVIRKGDAGDRDDLVEVILAHRPPAHQSANSRTGVSSSFLTAWT